MNFVRRWEELYYISNQQLLFFLAIISYYDSLLSPLIREFFSVLSLQILPISEILRTFPKSMKPFLPTMLGVIPHRSGQASLLIMPFAAIQKM